MRPNQSRAIWIGEDWLATEDQGLSALGTRWQVMVRAGPYPVWQTVFHYTEYWLFREIKRSNFEEKDLGLI